MVIPTSDVQMTTHWPDRPGQEGSPQPQHSMAGHPYYQVSSASDRSQGWEGNRRAQLPASQAPSSRTMALPMGFPVWRTSSPRWWHPQRSILLGFSTRHVSCLVCIWLPEPRLLPQPRAVRLDKNNLEEGENHQRRLFKVMEWVEGLRACSPRFHTAGSAQRPAHSSAPPQASNGNK